MEIDLTLDEVKAIELDVLKVFHQMCEKYSLRYSLAYGTLLGAIRHQGFIPWDDDIDVMMPRPDYIRFINLFDDYFKDTVYSLAAMQLNDDYFAPLVKMYNNTTRVYQNYGQIEKIKFGVYIDIFVVDGLPEENASDFYNQAEILRYKWGRSCRKLLSKHRSRNIITDIGGSVLSLPYKIKGFKYYRDRYDALCSKYEYDNADNIAVVLYGEGLKKEMMNKTCFDNRTLVNFEGNKFYSVEDPKLYLQRMYGDYMCLPPENERVSKHGSRMVKLN